MNEIENAIEDLKDLRKHSSIKTNMFKEMHGKSFDLAISALEKQKNGDWIPVSERLPEKKGDYLVTYGNGKIMTHWYVDELKCWLNKEWIKQVGGVIAWQPLPEKYKGGEDGTNR